MEIAARKTEQDRDLLFVDDHRIRAHPGRFAGQRDHDRIRRARRTVRTPDQIRAALAIKRGTQHGHADHAARPQRFGHCGGAGFKIGPAVDVGEVAEDPAPHRSRIMVEAMVLQFAGAGRVAGRHDLERQEFHVRRDAVDPEKHPHQRVVEGLEQLAVRQRGNALCIRRADAAPQRPRTHAVFQQAFQARQGFAQADIVEIDPSGVVAVREFPVAALEASACAAGDVREARVVVVEAVGDQCRRALRGIWGTRNRVHGHGGSLRQRTA